MTLRKKIILISAGLFVIMAFFTGAWIYSVKYRLTEVAKSAGPSGSGMTVTVYMKGEPVFPYGPSYVKAVLRKDGKKVDSEEITVYNDGARAEEGDFSFEWQDDSVIITVSGDEMEDTDYILTFN